MIYLTVIYLIIGAFSAEGCALRCLQIDSTRRLAEMNFFFGISFSPVTHNAFYVMLFLTYTKCWWIRSSYLILSLLTLLHWDLIIWGNFQLWAMGCGNSNPDPPWGGNCSLSRIKPLGAFTKALVVFPTSLVPQVNVSISIQCVQCKIWYQAGLGRVRVSWPGWTWVLSFGSYLSFSSPYLLLLLPNFVFCYLLLLY